MIHRDYSARRQALQASVPWAVWLGCNTAWRLSREWRIPKERAATLLSRAEDRGNIRRLGRGRYAVPADWT